MLGLNRLPNSKTDYSTIVLQNVRQCGIKSLCYAQCSMLFRDLLLQRRCLNNYRYAILQFCLCNSSVFPSKGECFPDKEECHKLYIELALTVFYYTICTHILYKEAHVLLINSESEEKGFSNFCFIPPPTSPNSGRADTACTINPPSHTPKSCQVGYVLFYTVQYLCDFRHVPVH